MKIGVIGTGRIAERFVTTSGAEIAGVFNCNIESAKRFADIYQIAYATDVLDELLDISDAIYVAAPHETHYDYTKRALMANKHVLCEKPLALSKRSTEELFEISSEKNLVLLEAVKTAYCPGFQALIDKARSGVIGNVVDVEAAFTRLTPENLREFCNVEYGGSFLEFGTYTMLPAIILMGTEYNDIFFKSVKAKTGVDAYTKVFIDYGDRMATCKTGLSVKSEGQLLISGTKGYILAKSPWWLTKEFEVRFENPNIKEVCTYEYVGSGMQYEYETFCRAVETGEVPNVEVSIASAGIMEAFLKQREAFSGN